MSHSLTPDEVRKVARLARLKLTEAEVETFTHQLSDILGYIDLLNEANTEEVEPMVHAIELSNVLREDRPQTSLPREEALKNAPSSDGHFFLVPPILDAE